VKLTVKEAAARASVCESVIRGWIKSGLLPHYRLGLPGRRGKIVIEVEDLDGMLANFKVSGPAPKPAPKSKPITLKHLRLPF
jgi:excisionase family DNA binding protein